MRRFCGMSVKGGRSDSTERSVVISVLVFLTVLVGFLYVIGETTEQTLQEQQKNLEAAVEQSLLQCYVTEGRYPENFSYLQENYGLVYDEEQFRVDYRVYGTNMRPEVEVLVLEELN